MPNDTIIAYKGFSSDWTCRGFRYEVGQTYTHDGPVSLCNAGFHVCEQPMDVFSYYQPGESQYAQVELGGASNEKRADTKRADTKRVGKTLTVKCALDIAGLVKAQIEWVRKQADGKSIAEGRGKSAAASGDSSSAASSGDFSRAACDTNGFACIAGLSGRVRGNAGSALSLGYRDKDGRNRIAVGYVGENGIEPDVWYRANERGELEQVT